MMKKILFSLIILFLLFAGFNVLAQEAPKPEQSIVQGEVELPDPGLTPDSPFYFLDTLGEKIGMFFTFGAEKKAEKALKYAEEKLAEAKAMAERNKAQALERANQRYQEFLNLANAKTKEVKEEGKDVEELAILITEKTLKHREILVEVFGKIPEEAKTAIEKAIEVSRRGSEEAVQAVTGAKKEELQKRAEEITVKVEENVEVEISCKDGLDCPSQMKCENSICVDAGCIEEGGLGPSAGINPEWLEHLPTECCEGLKSITYSRNFDENCKFMPPPGAPTGVCSKCDNGICEGWETKCNCPEDCKAPNVPIMLDIDVSTTAGKPYTIGWKAISEATNYILERDTNSSFSNPIIVSSRTLNSFSETLSPSFSTRYYFRVKACNKYGCSSWSKTTELWVEACPLPEVPVLTGPGVSVNNNEPYTLNWTSVRCATGYWYQSGYGAPVFDAPAVYTKLNSITQTQHLGTSVTFYYRVKACNDYGCSAWSNIVDIQVIVAPFIRITSPNGGERWVKGQTYNIEWQSYRLEKVTIDLFAYNAEGQVIKGFQYFIAESVDATKLYYKWTIPEIADYPNYKLRIYNKLCTGGDVDLAECLKDQYFDESDNYFSIVKPSITVTSPNGGEKWKLGNTYEVTWDSVGVEKVDVSYLNMAIGLGQGIGATGVSASLGKYSFTIPTNDPNVQIGNKYKVYIRGEARDGSRIEDWSNDYFSIVPSITVISPDGGETWTIGQTKRVSWSSTGVNYVRIYIYDESIAGSGSTNYIYDGAISASTGYYDWTIQKNQLPGATLTFPRNYKIRIDGVNETTLGSTIIVWDQSDSYFSVTEL